MSMVFRDKESHKIQSKLEKLHNFDHVIRTNLLITYGKDNYSLYKWYYLLLKKRDCYHLRNLESMIIDHKGRNV